MLLRYIKDEANPNRASVYCQVFIYDTTTNRDSTIEVDKLPIAEDRAGFYSQLYCNPADNTTWYEYVAVPPAAPETVDETTLRALETSVDLDYRVSKLELAQIK